MAIIETWPRVAVVGAGAVGCYFGGMLARAGVPVTLIGRPPHVEAIARDGLLLQGLRVDERIPVAVTASTEQGVRGADIVLFCVKSVSTESAALEIRAFLKPAAAILSLQNGVDNPDRIHAAIHLHPIPTAVYVAAEMTAPGHVTHTGRGDLIIGYRPGWPHQPDLEPLAAMFRHADVPCVISPDIAAELWGKMLMNCAFNAVSALTRSQYGRMFSSKPVRNLCLSALAEAVAVARAEGVSVSLEAAEQAALRISESMAGATSSMAQDIARGRRTEIDSLNGYVAWRGSALGIPTPVSDQLTALIRLLEEAVVTRPSRR
ncbi:MAG: 2-dehydropantoate 2-reductase [Bryobacterales bacterium]|nr:2-dehydropantoate 2-reductase [Bryobacterales bacterium]